MACAVALETLVAALRHWATAAPEQVAYRQLGEDDQVVADLSYGQLDRRAQAIAAQIARRQLPSDACALVMYPEGLDFIAAFMGCLYAGVAAVPVPFAGDLRSVQDARRLQAIAADAGAAVLLTTSAGDQSADLPIPRLVTDTLSETDAATWEPAAGNQRSSPQNVAYIQYTSGSTAAPKGIAITHSNLVASFAALNASWSYEADSAVLTWMPHVHDFGLVEGLLRPLAAGIPCTIMSPWVFVRRPVRWLRAIGRYHITHSGGATFAYDWCLRRIPPEQHQGLDLSSWQVAHIGAEPIWPAIIERFTEAFAAVGFRKEAFCPGYGLAESTLLATAKPKGAPVALRDLMVGSLSMRLTGCGTPHGADRVLIVDPETRRPCEPGQVGEVWVAGPAVAAGYWRKPEATQEVFQARLAESDAGPFLRTGDLGLLDQDELFVTGRLKDMLIIRGQNLYPQDIEWALADCHPAVEGHLTAAFGVAVEHDEQRVDEQLVIAQEVDPRRGSEATWEEVIAAIRRRIAEQFELPLQAIVLLRRGDLPKTSSGKLRRHACRDAYLAGEWQPVASWRRPELEEPRAQDLTGADLVTRLTAIWQELLHTPVGPDDNFFELGGDSLTALRMTLEVEEALGCSVPNDFFGTPTVNSLAVLLGDSSRVLPERQTAAADSAPEPSGNQTRARSLRRRFSALPQRLRLRLLGLLESPAFRLPYFEGFRWLMAWCGKPWVQALFYAEESRLVSRLAESVGTPPAQVAIETQLSLVAHSIRRRMPGKKGPAPGKVIPLIREPREAGLRQPLESADWLQYYVLHGADHLDAALQQNRGIIFVGPHTPTRFAVRHFLQRRFETHQMVGYPAYHSTWQDLLADQGLSYAEGKKAARSAVAIAAARTLFQGGVVAMAGDEEDAQTGQPALIGDRLHHLVTGFAELAVSTGAAIVPFYTQFLQDGRIQISFLPSLLWDRDGDREMQVRAIMAQYGAAQTQLWRQAPGALLHDTVLRHLDCPLALKSLLISDRIEA